MRYYSNSRWYRRSVKRLLGLIKLRGKLQGEVFSIRYGKQIIRAIGNMNGKRFWSDPAFAGSQKTARILGAAAQVSKVLRDGIGPGASAVGGRKLHTRMTTLIQKGMLRGRNLRSDGLIKATDWLPGLSGFWLKPQRGGLRVSDFGRHHVFSDPNGTGDSIWSFRGVGTPYLKDLPNWAGFVRFSVIGIAVSDVLPKGDGSGFLSVRPDIHGLRQVRRSPLLRIREVRDFTWQVNLDGLFDGINILGAGVVVAIGVECFDDDLQLAMDGAAVPFGALLPGWDSEGVPEGDQSRERFMWRKWKEAGMSFKALEIIWTQGEKAESMDHSFIDVAAIPESDGVCETGTVSILIENDLFTEINSKEVIGRLVNPHFDFCGNESGIILYKHAGWPALLRSWAAWVPEIGSS